MPDAIQSVQSQPGDMTGSISGWLGIKQRQQALQTGAYAQQAQAAEAAQSQQKNAELQKAQQLAMNPDVDADGKLDRVSTADKISRLGPYAQQMAGSFLSQANEVVQNKQALQTLNDDQRKAMSQSFASLAQNPNLTQSDVIDEASRLININRDPSFQRMVLSNMAHLPQNAPSQQLRKIAGQWAQAFGGPSQQTPSTIDNGSSIQPGVTNNNTGGFTPAGAPIAKQIGPGANLVADAYGRTNVFNPQKNTVTPIGAGGGSNNFAQPVADQNAILADLRETRAATNQGGITRNVNQHLIDLSKQTETGGWGTETAQKFAATLGMPSGSRFQEIGAYLDRQAALQAQAMGVPHTNAGLAAAERASGTTDYTPKALQEKVKFADALNSGSMAYRQGLDKVVGTEATPDLTKYQAYRSAWSKNFDPDVFRLEDAQRRGDREEQMAIAKRVGKKGAADLARKSANLRQLESGVIPGG